MKKLKINGLSSNIKTSLLKINAMFDLKSGGNYKKLMGLQNLNSLAVKSILKNNFREVVNRFDTLDFRGHSIFSIEGDYGGGLDLGVKISGNFFKYRIESFDNFEIDLKIDESEISLNPFIIKKGSSSIFSSGKI